MSTRIVYTSEPFWTTVPGTLELITVLYNKLKKHFNDQVIVCTLGPVKFIIITTIELSPNSPDTYFEILYFDTDCSWSWITDEGSGGYFKNR